MKIKLGRIPLPNKPPKIIDSSRRRLLENLEEAEAMEEIEEHICNGFYRGITKLPRLKKNK